MERGPILNVKYTIQTMVHQSSYIFMSFWKKHDITKQKNIE